MQPRKRSYADHQDMNVVFQPSPSQKVPLVTDPLWGEKKQLDYSYHPKPKRHQRSSNDLPSSTLAPALAWPSSGSQVSMGMMAPPTSTMAPSAMHLGQPADQLDYSTAYSAPDAIDSILASAVYPTPMPQDRQHYARAAANLYAFNQELPPLQGPQHQEVEPRPRQPNEPWAPFDPTMMQPPIGRRLCAPGQSSRASRHVRQNNQVAHAYRLSGTWNATGKANSDCGYALGDSGYGGSFGVISPATRSKASRGDCATQSVFSGDVNHQHQESLSITAGLGCLDFESQPNEATQSDPFDDEYSHRTVVDTSHEINRAITATKTTKPDGPPWTCTECDVVPFKNKSEHKFVLRTCFSCSSLLTRFPLRKHMLRHLKPYKCDYGDCNRRGHGFSTRNDLDRHRKSLHKVAPKTSTDKTFMCVAPTCKNKSKTWPRADNFRQHCLRLHRDIDVEYLVRESCVSSELAGFRMAG